MNPIHQHVLSDHFSLPSLLTLIFSPNGFTVSTPALQSTLQGCCEFFQSSHHQGINQRFYAEGPVGSFSPSCSAVLNLSSFVYFH